MPRWASRITLEVMEVRAERLWSISPEDAEAEGIKVWTDSEAFDKSRTLDKWANYSCSVARNRGEPRPTVATSIGAYALLWDAMHKKDHPWKSNPWVWVYGFRRLS